MLAGYAAYGLRGAISSKSAAQIQPLLWGIVAGAGLALIRELASKFWPALSFENAAHPMLKGPVGIWAAIIILGGFAEELWRALCLLAIRRYGGSVADAILCTAIVFAISELAGRPSRISSQREEVFYTVLVGLCLAQMLVTFRSISMAITANVVYHGLAFYRLRTGTYAESEAEPDPTPR